MARTATRATVGQDKLARSAAIIAKMAKAKRAAPSPRYAFIRMDRHLFALRAGAGETSISCGGITYRTRSPRTAAEKQAVLRAEAVAPALPVRRPADPVTLMAHRIIEAAGRGVERRDFRQAGVAEADIDANFDAAMAIARRMEPRLDQMVSG